MGLFDKLFGKKPARASSPADEDEDLRPTAPPQFEGPPEFVRAAELQRAYWTHNADEQGRLEERGVEQLHWPDCLRLHHLLCLQRLNPGPERAAAAEKCRRTARRLLDSDSPYRPRSAKVWQGQAAQPGNTREPDLQGLFLNASLTHFGALEIYHLNAANEPTGIGFVGFDELAAVLFAPTKLVRAAKLFYEDGRDEIVFVPLLYGLTWTIGNDYDRDGRMTRFVSHLNDEDLGSLGASGLGVGHQDFTIDKQDQGSTLFGLGSVAEISFPLDMRDPRFDVKARARGLDPDELRRQMTK